MTVDLVEALHAALHQRTYCDIKAPLVCTYRKYAEKAAPFLVLEFEERLIHEESVKTVDLRYHLASEHGVWRPGPYGSLDALHVIEHNRWHGHPRASRAYDLDKVHHTKTEAEND